MDLLTDNAHLSLWLVRYGSLVLFFLLALGIIALPVPEETMMVIAGILMNCDKLHILPTALFAYAGSITGITVSYILGRTVGFYLITKYGRWIGITELRLMKAHYWFEKFGKWSLFIGYFVPGIRHFTGLSAGIAKLDYKRFALFAYSGAFIWVTTFLALGYFFGHYWAKIYEKIELGITELIVVLLAIVCFSLIVYFFKKDKS